MSTHIDNQMITSPYANPTISYLVTYTAIRTGYDVIYNFTIKSYLSAGGTFGSGYVLKCIVGIDNETSEAYLKNSTDIWKNSNSSKKLVATNTLTIACKSTKGKENQTVYFKVIRPEGTYGDGNSGKVNTSEYYVISPVLDGSGYIWVDGIAKRGMFWIKNNGVWQKGVPWTKKDGVWQKGG